MTEPTVPSTFQATQAPPRPRPLQSLAASARRLTKRTLASRVGSSRKSWQDDAWEMFDLVGEHRFLAVTLAGRMSQAKLYVGKMSDDPTEDPAPVTDPSLTAILDAVGNNATARAQIIARLGVNLFVAGDGWITGIPRHLFPPSMVVGGSLTVDPELAPPEPPVDDTLNIADLEWRMLSVSEVLTNQGGTVQLQFSESQDETLQLDPDKIVLIRVWRPHPRRWWQADSPTRSSLPVLREIVGLTMRSSAEIDSRLAGAGILVIPQSAQRAIQLAAGKTDEDDDVFTESLMDAMITPISDRANASALVPLVVTVPDESVEKFKHMDFAAPLDQFAAERLDQAIRRLALGLDAPPELLLGTGGMNHWGAWLVLEDVVTTHLEPPLAIICDALTTQYLWSVLVDQGMSPDEAHQYVIWYDVSDLVVRPNRGADAQALHEKGVISDAALRAASGFDEADAPPQLPQEIELALAAITQAPSLLAAPGLPALVEQIRAVLTGDTSKLPAVAPVAPVAPVGSEPVATLPGTSVPTGPPATDSAPAEIPAAQAASASPATLEFPIIIDDPARDVMAPHPSLGKTWDEVIKAVPHRTRR